MRRHPVALAIALTLASALPAAAQTRGADRPADAAAIRAHIESIFQAFVDKDRAKLAATHGAEWRGFTPWAGHVIRGRDGYMNEATFPPGIPKGQGMVGYRIGEFDIVFYADTAVFGSRPATVCGMEFFGPDKTVFASDAPFDPEKGPMYIRETIKVIESLGLPQHIADFGVGEPELRKAASELGGRYPSADLLRIYMEAL